MTPKVYAFVCPRCAATSASPMVSYEATVEYRRPLVRLREGGPLVEDTSEPEEPRVTGRIYSTDACACRFPSSEWNLELVTDPSGHARMVLTAKAATP